MGCLHHPFGGSPSIKKETKEDNHGNGNLTKGNVLQRKLRSTMQPRIRPSSNATTIRKRASSL